MDERAVALAAWLRDTLEAQGLSLGEASCLPVSGDASFRRYFRLRWGSDAAPASVIGVDAPPDKEDCAPFVRLSTALHAHGVRVPRVLAREAERGFMMLDDLGDTLLRAQLDEASVDALYDQAMTDLLHVQTCPVGSALPPYDEALLLREMALFRDWFLVRHLGMALSDADEAVLHKAFAQLAAEALAQPRVTVHRDYHSRNIMVLADGALGHIDFQDAVYGPLTYDLVSLLRDCYIDWPVGDVERWALAFAARLRAAGRLAVDDAQFLRWFDLMGAQRHLKAVGIFSRLCHRDAKPGYLGDIPRTFRYLLQETASHAAFGQFHAWLVATCVPRLLAKDPQAARYLDAP